MPTVVQDQQQLARLEMGAERVREGRAGPFLHAKHLRDRRRHQQWIVDRPELHQPDAVAVGIHHFAGHLQRKPRLANAACGNERQQAFTRQQPAETCTARLLSSTTTPGQAASMILSFGTHSLLRFTSVVSTATAREPNALARRLWRA